MTQKPISIFVSYSHKDEQMKEQLVKHLTLLQAQGFITMWHDRNISAGTEWIHDINKHLSTAHIILLLVSADFLASTYCYGVEMEYAMKRHELGDAHVIPIILRPVNWYEAPFGKLQALPKEGKPITSWHNQDGRDRAFTSIARSIKLIIKEIQIQQTPSDIIFSGYQQSEYLKTSFQEKKDNHPLFLVGQLPREQNDFYGRVDERETLLHRVRWGGSVSVVGPHRLGKTWLLRYLHLVSAERLGSQFRVAYLDATAPNCNTVESFVLQVLKLFNGLSFPKETTGLSSKIAGPLGMWTLHEFFENYTHQGLKPILCIDEIEAFACKKEEFDMVFFSNLRAIAMTGLSLVTASSFPLYELFSENNYTRYTSDWFNIFLSISIEPFKKKDAEDFLLSKSTLIDFSKQEQKRILKYGQIDIDRWHPLYLQLAGEILFTDKKLAGEVGSYYNRPRDSRYWLRFEKRLEMLIQNIEGKDFSVEKLYWKQKR